MMIVVGESPLNWVVEIEVVSVETAIVHAPDGKRDVANSPPGWRHQTKLTMTTSDPILKLEQFLPYRLMVLAEAVSQSLSRIYAAEFGLTIPEWRVIATLGQFDTMTAKAIGEHSKMHKTKVSRAVAALTQKSLIESAPNADDLRESFLTLSARGRAVYGRLAPKALEFDKSLSEGFTTVEKDQLDRFINRLSECSSTLLDDIDKSVGRERISKSKAGGVS